MNWIETEGASFIYSNEGRVKRKRAEFNTIFGKFEVFQAVSGKTFYRHPFIKNVYIGALGFNNGIEDWLGPTRASCKSIKEGKAICEGIIQKIKSIVNSY